MSPPDSPVPLGSRRRVLAGLGVALAAGLAGCAGGNDSGSDGAVAATPTRTGTAASGSDGTGVTDTGTGTGGGELDLREANVVGVTVERQGDRYSFDVTVHHDDDGEAGYANWWQVERLDGSRIGRRELLHPHSRQPFTRSDAFEIPGGVDCVVVRGHDETHGYGGRAMTVDLASGATRAVEQGSEREPITGADCP